MRAFRAFCGAILVMTLFQYVHPQITYWQSVATFVLAYLAWPDGKDDSTNTTPEFSYRQFFTKRHG